ncbi:hypothetical protein OU995_26580 [Roseateles sp. SL47]|uniref:hypothetical protein n=1 Tax=Roseateles sp. SL47 TaxID=2995138 RepID=UPI0022718F8F|nr:hypothetical protein [Roseateles sp. SL47]WAC73032.1 hypothetical protein OU995_26580 [Roseateles sp. SL47]
MSNLWMARRKLPAGIAVFAVLTETNLLSTYLPERIKARQIPRNWKFPVEPVTNYIHDLELLRDGLIAARDQFIHMRQGLVNNAGLGGIPEGVAIVKAVSKHYVGDEYAARADGYGEGSDYLGDMGHYPANAPDRIEQAVNHLMALIEAWVAEGNRLRGNLTDWPRSVLPLPS